MHPHAGPLCRLFYSAHQDAFRRRQGWPELYYRTEDGHHVRVTMVSATEVCEQILARWRALYPDVIELGSGRFCCYGADTPFDHQ